MKAFNRPPLILASASPRRLQLLKQIGILPDEVMASDIDEGPHKNEIPTIYAPRIAREKALVIAANHRQSIVLAADTVVACGRRILPKAEDEKSARMCLSLLEGRRHRVYTSVVVAYGDKIREVLVRTDVRFARLSSKDIDAYIATNEWHGKAGGYAIQGCAEAFIPWIGGSYSNVVGLPLTETAQLLYNIQQEASRPTNPQREQ